MNDDEHLGATIRSALQARADRAPEALGLARGARTRLTLRRRRRVVVAAAGSAVVVIGGVALAGGWQAPNAVNGPQPVPASAGETPGATTEKVVVVPDVWGLPLAEAEQALTDAGLVVRVETAPFEVGCVSRPCPDAGDVAAQSPVPGHAAFAGSIVTLTVLVDSPLPDNGCELPHDADGDGDVDGDVLIPAERIPDCYFVGEEAQPHQVALYHCGVLPTTFLGERWEVPDEEVPFDETNAPAEFVGTGVMALLTWEQAVYRDDSGIKIAFVPAEQVQPGACL